MPIDAIDTAAVLKVLKPIWSRAPETAARLRGRIESILNYAKAHKLRDGENPASWRGHLALILPKRPKLSRGHHAATHYRDVPAFVSKLRKAETVPASALEFTILTAARIGEVLGAEWSEIDLAAKIWVIPGRRMKSGVGHRVPLSARAMQIIEQMAAIRVGDFIFPGQRKGRPISHSSVKKEGSGTGTIHGFRSSFRDWAGEETSFPREVAEQALAHQIGNAVENAYRRGDALEKRRELMAAWANYCEPGACGNVIALRKEL
jgi:integrase